MSGRNIALMLLLVSCVLALSCRKIERAQAPPTGKSLPIETLKVLDAIPAEYGNLVGVTSEPRYPDWAQLWFEKPDKTIVVVKVQWAKGYINEKVLIIPRRQGDGSR